jgi:hypothetical protein
LNFPNLSRTIILLLLTGIPLGAFGGFAPASVTHATASIARLEVWSPDLHSSNITSLTLFPIGNLFTALVNVTGAGQIGAFDMTLNYNLTEGPNVLQVVSGTLSRGLFDPNSPPAGCSVLVPHHDLFIPGYIRFAATYVGGCSRDGTGIILSLVFQVMDLGAGSIDIIQPSAGATGTTIVGAGSVSVPYTSHNAYFRNKPGTPPLPVFTFNPPGPVIGDTVTFNGTLSSDPKNPTAPNHGIQPEPVVYDADGDGKFQSSTDRVLYGNVPADGSVLRRDSNLLFSDTNGNGHWDPGEPVLYDADNSLTFTLGDILLSGPKPLPGTPLSVDPRILYFDLHPNGIWDDGYIWQFGDGTRIVPGNVTGHIFLLRPTIPAAGIFSVKLVVWNGDQLPAETIVLLRVAPGPQSLGSLNWSGYAVAGQPGLVSDVTGSWIIPAIIGTCSVVEQHAAFWVGIDGLTSSTVEQTGTDSACINGAPTYFAWFEFFPKPAVKINKVPVHPGDIISAEVQFSNNKFTASITDVTTGTSFTKSERVKGAERSSAEWIAEAPSSTTGILPLANFGTVLFGQDYTGVAGTCTATVGSSTMPIGAFGSTAVIITMMNSGRGVKAQPSLLTKDKTSFAVLWKQPL